MNFSNPFFFQGPPPQYPPPQYQHSQYPYPGFTNFPPPFPHRNYGMNLSQFAPGSFEPHFPFDRPNPLFIHQQNNYFAPNYDPAQSISNPFFERLLQNNEKTNKINTIPEQRPFTLSNPQKQIKKSTTPIQIIQILSDEQPNPIPKHKLKSKQIIQQKKPFQKKEKQIKNKKERQRLLAIGILPDMDNLETKIITRAAKKKITKRIKALRKLEVQIYNPDYQQPTKKTQKSKKYYIQDSQGSEDLWKREEQQYKQTRRQKTKDKYNDDNNINPIPSLSKNKEENHPKTSQKPPEIPIDSLFSATPPTYLTKANYQLYLLKIRSSLLQRRRQ